MLNYQRNLRRLPTYRLRADQVPVSRRKLFLGRGFRWTQKHPAPARHHPPRGSAVCPARSALSLGAPQGGRLGGDTDPELACGGIAQPRLVESPQAAAAGRRQTGAACRGARRTGCLDGHRRAVGHTLVLGTTRVGKTRLAEILITQDIRRGDVVIVFDPKGDADLLRRVYAEAKRAGRADEFFLFHLGYPEVSARYNAIGSFSRITEVATRIANQLPSEGNSAAFKGVSPWRFVNIIARALVALGRRPDYQQVRRYINDIEPLFVEYARKHLQENGGGRQTWPRSPPTPGAQPARGAARTPSGRGRPDALSERPGPLRSGPRRPGLGVPYDKTCFDKIVSSAGP